MSNWLAFVVLVLALLPVYVALYRILLDLDWIRDELRCRGNDDL